MQKLRRSIRVVLQVTLPIILCTVLLASSAKGSTIAIVTDPDDSCIQLNIAEGTTRRVYLIYAWGIGPQMYSTQIRIHGLPPGWSVSVQKGPEVAGILGDLFGTGAGIVLSSIQPVSPIVLATLDITAGSGGGTMWAVPSGQMNPPSFGDTQILIREPGGATHMSFSTPMFLNQMEDCETAVESRTWSHVKALYLR